MGLLPAGAVAAIDDVAAEAASVGVVSAAFDISISGGVSCSETDETKFVLENWMPP